jgi:hypothetical protein
VLSQAVRAHCSFVVTSSTAVARGAKMGSCVVVFVCTVATYLFTVTSLPVVAELFTFGALIRGACREVFYCPPWLAENHYCMFQESL